MLPDPLFPVNENVEVPGESVPETTSGTPVVPESVHVFEPAFSELLDDMVITLVTAIAPVDVAVVVLENVRVENVHPVEPPNNPAPFNVAMPPVRFTVPFPVKFPVMARS